MSTHKNPPSSRLASRLREAFGFYVGLPAALAYLFCLALFWRPIASWLLGAGSWLVVQVTAPDWLSGFLISVISNALAAIVIALPIWFWLRNRKLSALAKTYDAFNFDTESNSWIPWGELTLKYELLPSQNFQPHFKCELVHEAIVLCGTATLSQDQYLAGHYKERDNHLRRRTGAFLMQLNGDGNALEGTYSYVDPTSQSPVSGKARWVMKKG